MFKFFKKNRIKYKCPCCEFYTFDKKPNGEYDICPVCFWEDDPFQAENPDLEGMANTVSLNQARENFKKFGACEQDMVKNVRSPKKDELVGFDS